jgi:hypothetical protein
VALPGLPGDLDEVPPDKALIYVGDMGEYVAFAVGLIARLAGAGPAQAILTAAGTAFNDLLRHRHGDQADRERHAK